MNLEIVKVVNSDVKFKSKNGKEYTQVNYYVVVNGNYIAIRPAFSTGYMKLDLIARVVKNGSKE